MTFALVFGTLFGPSAPQRLLIVTAGKTLSVPVAIAPPSCSCARQGGNSRPSAYGAGPPRYVPPTGHSARYSRLCGWPPIAVAQPNTAGCYAAVRCSYCTAPHAPVVCSCRLPMPRGYAGSCARGVVPCCCHSGSAGLRAIVHLGVHFAGGAPFLFVLAFFATGMSYCVRFSQ